MRFIFVIVFVSLLLLPVFSGQNCIECHKKISPGIVKDWEF